MFAAGLAVALLMCLGLTGKAQASSVSCSGTINPTTEGHAEEELAYFGTETVVFGTDGEVAEGESFGCEGSIPSWGIGCQGKMTAGNTVESSIGTSESLCEAAVQPKFWVTALTYQDVKGTPTPFVSEPYLLRIKPCAVLNPTKKAMAKRDKVCSKVKSAKSRKARAAARKRCKAAIKAVKKLKAS